MRCDRLPVEVYGLSALGLLDGAEREELRAHLSQGCETCREELDRSLRLWYSFAAAVPLVAPPAGLRARILQAIRPKVVAFPARMRWTGAVGIAAALLLAAALGWIGSERWYRPKPLPVDQARVVAPVVQPQPAPAPVTPPAPAAPAPAVRTVIETVRDPELELALARANAEVQKAANALAQERAAVARLEAELVRQRTQLAAADRARQEAETRLESAASAQQQLAAERARVRELDSEVARLKDALAVGERRLEQSIRLANMMVSPGVRFLKVRAAGKGAGAGHAIVADGRGVVFFASELPPPRPGKTYQLWLIRSRAPAIVSGGTFTPDARRSALVQFDDAALASGVTAVAVTDEPMGGSAKPTGQKLLIGS
jgi:hypothetical protein